MRIIDRYLWKEFLHQFLMWGAVITVLGIGKIFFDYNDLFIGYRITAALLLRLLVNQLPALWMDVVPFATLLGVILSFNRLLRERELDVIRLNGASLLRIALPVGLGVLLICIGAFWWNDLVVPAANHRFDQAVRQLAIREDLPLLRENVVFKGPNNRFIYLNRVDHKMARIKGVLIIEAGVSGRWPRLITADYGQLRRGVWELYNGVVHQFDATGAVTVETKYQRMILRMGMDFSAIVGEERSPTAMRTGELRRLIGLYKRSGLALPVFTVFYHLKFADPLISLVLVCLGIPLTLLMGRNGRWLGLILGIGIILAYYTMQVVGRTLGANGLIPPWAAAWSPHLIFLAVGLMLFYRIEQRR